MTDKDEQIRFTVQMRRQLREDAKRNTERGELSESIRELFRRKAYGLDNDSSTELQRTKAELQDVRDRIDDLRRERRRIDAEIETQESRATRLEERVSSLEDKGDKFDAVLTTLEGMLLDGARVFPERVDDDLDAQRVIEELQDRNPDVPKYAFDLADPAEPNDWREVKR